MFIDSHAHLSGDTLWPNIDSLLERAKQANVNTIINICTDPVTLERGIKLASKNPYIFNAASTTPHDVDKEGELLYPDVAQAAKKEQLIAIGETGLDYYYEHSKKETQKKFLKKYLHLALEYQLPVIIHCRDAFDDFFEILDAEYSKNGKHAPGVLHCFTGTTKEAEEVIKRGWFLSLSGIVTFKRSKELRQVAKMVPLDQLLIETDSPYLAPQSKRGKTNEPSYLPETADMIAKEKNLSIQEIAEHSTFNAKNLFRLDRY